DGGARAGVLFQPERGHDALRYGVGAGLLRGGLRTAGGVVAAGVPYFAGQSGDLAGDRPGVVETGGDLVNPGVNPGGKPGVNPGTDGTFSGFRRDFSAAAY